MNGEKNKLMVCFLPSSSELLEKSVLNTLAAKLAPSTGANRSEPMVHAELFFPKYEMGDVVGGDSCGIHYGGKVFVSPKTFSRKNWVFRSISCTPEQYKSTMDFCQSQVGGGFNYLGYYAPCNLFNNGGNTQNGMALDNMQSWYCSELTAAALRHSNILSPSASDAHKHPESLYQAIMDVSYADSARKFTPGALQL